MKGGARSKARKRALDVLFAADVRREPILDALAAAEAGEHPPTNPYTAVLVRGVAERRARIDEVLGEHSTAWTLPRMPAVDRNVLRIGAWEMLYAPDVPPHVAVSEAIALVRELSTDESPTFVNGLLGAIERRLPELVAADGLEREEPVQSVDEPGVPD